MKIGILTANEFTTPPPENIIYASLEVAAHLAKGLLERGHKVTLFASSDSKIRVPLKSFNLISYNKIRKKRKEGYNYHRVLKYEQLFISRVFTYCQQEKFDLIHSHTPSKSIYFAPFIKTPILFTSHDPLTRERLRFYEYFSKYKNIFWSSLSDSQRKGSRKLNFAGTVYNGIDLQKFLFHKKSQDYLAFLGRIIPEKGAGVAIRVALKTKSCLKIAGPIYKSDSKDYNQWLKEKVTKYFSRKNIHYLGLVEKGATSAFLGQARALLVPLGWEEPFGLVMIEAMASGTPVIAFRRGSVPEIIIDGKTGFVVKDEKEMIEAVRKIQLIKRWDCRSYVEKNFTSEIMARNYEKIYQKIIRDFKSAL